MLTTAYRRLNRVIYLLLEWLFRGQYHEPCWRRTRGYRRFNNKPVRVDLCIRQEVVGFSGKRFHMSNQGVEVARRRNLCCVVEVDIHRERNFVVFGSAPVFGDRGRENTHLHRAAPGLEVNDRVRIILE
jgi:hypothetical protein